MRFKNLLFTVLLMGCAAAADRPNILWITSEDNSAHWLGCYGNKNAKTPNIDALAAEGILFQNAYSNAPVCAVARSTLLMGRYATTMGTQNMRSRYPIPASMQSYAQLFNKAGYHTTNPGKTDYNILGNDKSHWNGGKTKKPWTKANLDKPFFHVVNFTSSHESSLFDRNGNTPIKPKLVKPSEVTLPPYLPDLKEIRNDWAGYYDKLANMDRQVGEVIDSLRKSKHADNTIIFYYSDHGGILARSKRFVFQTGTQVPFVVYLPKKWQHLSEHQAGSKVDDIVAFVDFGPTMLDVAGIKPQEDMQGNIFLGKNRKKKDFAYLYSQRFDEQVFKFVRGITDGKYRYVKNFYPHMNRGIPGGYPYGQAGWRAYKKFLDAGKGNAAQNFIWAKQAQEELYDVTADPWEVNNLAKDPQYADLLKKMQGQLKAKMLETKDTGILPEMFYTELSKNSTIYDFVNAEEFPYQEILDIAWQVPEDLDQLKKLLAHPHQAIRFWAATQCSIHKEKTKAYIPELKELSKDKHFPVQFAAAEALFLLAEVDAANEAILAILKNSTDPVVTIRALDLANKTGYAEKIDKATWNKFCSRGKYGQRLLRK